MYCPKCGTKNEDMALFCFECGNKFKIKDRDFTMVHDVFISHSSSDMRMSEAIYYALKKNGINCWIDSHNIRGGHDYAEEIMYGIENCKVFLLLYSGDSNNSQYVYRETERAVAYDKWIIPYRLTDTEMSKKLELLLSSPQWIFAADDDMEFTKLTTAVKGILAKQRGEQPPAPAADTPPEKQNTNYSTYQQSTYQQSTYQQPAYQQPAYQQSSNKSQQINFFMAVNADKFPPENSFYIRQQLEFLDEMSISYIQSIPYKNPTTVLILSICLGAIGVDRFYLGDIGLGIGKLMTLGGYGVWAFIDWFLSPAAARRKNFAKLMQAIGTRLM